MKMISRAILALALIAGTAPAIAQVPPPVPALPDTERRTSYQINASTCACTVNMALYGDSTDFQNWIEVFLNGVRINFNDPILGWTITSPTGPLSTIARPITDAVLTLTNAQTGTVQIVGARRPRRVSQFSENQGVSARNLNQVLTDIIAQNREIWDKTNDMTGRGMFSQPGNTMGLLPLPNVCANAFLGFDGTGLNPLCEQIVGAGSLATPGSTVNGNFAIWTGTDGRHLGDGGVPGTFAFQNYATPPSIGTTTPNSGFFTNIGSSTLATGAIITSTPTVTSAFCSHTAALGGNAQYTFTVGAASGYPPNCVMDVINVDPIPANGGRGKIMAINGITFPLQVLYPGMSYQLINIGGSFWEIMHLATRWKAPASTLTINTDFTNGNDANDGFGTTTGAKKTIQACLDTLANDFDFSAWAGVSGEPSGPTLAICSPAIGSTDTNAVHFSTHAFVGAQGGAAVRIGPNTGNATIQSATTDAIGLFLNAHVQLQNLNLATGGGTGSGITVGYNAEAQVMGGVTFGNINNGAHMSASDNGIIRVTSGYIIAGNANAHLLAQGHGQVIQLGGAIVVSGGSQGFAGAFATASGGGTINYPTVTWSGMTGATGQKYNAATLGNIITGGGGANYFPGSSAGTTNCATTSTSIGSCGMYN